MSSKIRYLVPIVAGLGLNVEGLIIASMVVLPLIAVFDGYSSIDTSRYVESSSLTINVPCNSKPFGCKK